MDDMDAMMTEKPTKGKLPLDFFEAATVDGEVIPVERKESDGDRDAAA